MYEWNKSRKLVYWGAGEVGRRCVSKYSYIRPCFIVDSYIKESALFDISIVNPKEIIDWSEYFIVITVEKKDVIKELLDSKGLKEKEDYIEYEVFFEIPAVFKY